MTSRQIIKKYRNLYLNKYDLRYGRKTGTLIFEIVTVNHYKNCLHESYRYTEANVERWLKITGRI